MHADERISSGAGGLDEVLSGGLPSNSINLIMGLPGTGKTVLAQQYVFTNATRERPAVYVSSISEPFEKIIRYGQSLQFFDADAVGESVFYEDLGAVLLEDGADAVLERVDELLQRYEPGLFVIDSFRPFAALIEPGGAYRRFVHELALRLTIRPLTSLWVGEYVAEEVGSSPEFAVADAVLWLTYGRYDDREVRLLQVLKLRGSGFQSGKHAYRLSSDGMHVFPRLADPTQESTYELAQASLSWGVASLDRVVTDGYQPGSSTLVIGPSGSGKTVLGLDFATAGPRQGERAIFATFDENPSQLTRAAAALGWSLTGRGLRLMYRSTVDLYLDEWVYELLALLSATKANRIVIDGLSNLRLAARDPVRFQEYLYSLVQRCCRMGLRLMMTLESAELFGFARLGEVGLSQMADNVILLQFLRRDGEYRRALTVLKSRGAKAEPRLHEYTIGMGGIELRGIDPPGVRH